MVVLYRKYRPQKLSDLTGQEGVKKSLLTALNQGKISHAYLFSGPKGTGKTTTARIVAKMLCCEKNVSAKNKKIEKFAEPCNECASCEAITNGTYLDVIEIDAASNRGIDDMRELREKIKTAPSLGQYKVYIIDEAHMLTNEAFNALLKTLEEPPAHVIFILCTTEPKKLPNTILSRCQKYEFKKAQKSELVEFLEGISKKEKYEYEVEAIELLAANSSGGFRDAASLLDQIASLSEKITVDLVNKNLSFSDEKYAWELIGLIFNKETQKALSLLEKYLNDGKDAYLLLKDLIVILERVLLARNGVGEEVIQIKNSDLEIEGLLKKLLNCEEQMKFTFLTQLPLELLIVDWCVEDEKSNKNNKIEKKEEKVKVEESVEKVKAITQDKKDTKSSEEVVTVSGDDDAEAEEILSTHYSSEFVELSENEFKTRWQEVLKSIRSVNHSLEALLRTCAIESFSENILVLGVYYKFHKDKLMDVKILRLLNECLNKVLGQKIVVKIVLKEKKAMSSSISEPNSDLADIANEIFSN